MISCMKLLLLVLCLATGYWIYFVPPMHQFALKYMAYRKFVPAEEATLPAGPNVTVELSLGKVVGTTIKPNLVDSVKSIKPVHQFLGIPFAIPPTGNLRFKKPKPVQKWSPKVIEATDWPASCLQNNRLMGLIQFAKNEFSEDCLYLNVWTPGLPGQSSGLPGQSSGLPGQSSGLPGQSSEKLKPVFVWIYGGGFSIGGSNQNLYHGHVLSSTQDVVVVTFNYRVGPFGFLVSPDAASRTDSQAPGNVGLWDQVMVLEWVQDHIRYFGGDPNQVTLAGESAGSISVSALFHSPVIRNLFHNIITMSGSSLIPTAFQGRETEVSKTKLLANVVGCPTQNDVEMMECLLRVDAEKLILRDIEVVKTFPGQESFTSGIMIFSPISGDELIPKTVKELITTGFEGQLANERKKMRVMSGIVNWEGGIMRLGKRDENLPLKKLQETNQWRQGIINWLINLNIDQNDAEIIVENYLNFPQNSGEMALFDLIGDYYLTCPSYLEMEAISKNVSSIHSYVWSFKPENNPIFNLICPDKDKVCHALELGYFFGGPLLKSADYFYDEKDHEQSIQTIELIGKFLKNEKLTIKRYSKNSENKNSGNKNSENKNSGKEKTELIDWIKYDSKLKPSLNFNHVKNNPFILDFRGKYCNLFRKYFL